MIIKGKDLTLSRGDKPTWQAQHPDPNELPSRRMPQTAHITSRSSPIRAQSVQIEPTSNKILTSSNTDNNTNNNTDTNTSKNNPNSDNR